MDNEIRQQRNREAVKKPSYLLIWITWAMWKTEREWTKSRLTSLLWLQLSQVTHWPPNLTKCSHLWPIGKGIGVIKGPTEWCPGSGCSFAEFMQWQGYQEKYWQKSRLLFSEFRHAFSGINNGRLKQDSQWFKPGSPLSKDHCTAEQVPPFTLPASPVTWQRAWNSQTPKQPAFREPTVSCA